MTRINSSELAAFLLAERYVPLGSLGAELATAELAEDSIVDRAILHFVALLGSLYGRSKSGLLQPPFLVEGAVGDHELYEAGA